MLSFRSSTTLLLAAVSLLGAVVSTEKVITCDGSQIVQLLSCDHGVIIVEAALYGRTNPDTCSEGRPAEQVVNTQCSLPGAVDILKRSCDGKKVCEVNTNAFHGSDPCHGTYKYVETTFKCYPANRVIACEHSLAHLQCDVGQVIFVYGADYGRRDKTTCSSQRPDSQVANVYCSNPTNKVAESCNGKTSCTVAAGIAMFSDPCVGTYKYLEVAYTCEYTGVISVEAALYGRADPVTCSEGRPAAQLANTQCSQQGTVNVLKTRCDGKRVCELNTEVISTSDPCSGTLKYLETKYSCLPANRVVACEQSLAHLYCDVGQVIFVYGADFGRHDTTTCSYKRPESQLTNVFCSNPTNKVGESCNGKNSCTVTASSSAFGDPCVGTYKYLEVAYTCQYPTTDTEAA